MGGSDHRCLSVKIDNLGQNLLSASRVAIQIVIAISLIAFTLVGHLTPFNSSLLLRLLIISSKARVRQKVLPMAIQSHHCSTGMTAKATVVDSCYLVSLDSQNQSVANQNQTSQGLVV